MKVIRSLMERSTVYRAISWPTALFGGGFALILGVVLFLRVQVAMAGGESADSLMSDRSWVFAWLFAMVVTGAFNALLIARKSSRDGRPFFSPGLKLAMRAIVPPMVAGGVLGVGQALSAWGTLAGAAAIWVICYGLALLATRGFAPKSMPRLGGAFLMAGMIAYAVVGSGSGVADPATDQLQANAIMAICFGLLNLVYGLLTMKSSSAGADGESAV